MAFFHRAFVALALAISMLVAGPAAAQLAVSGHDNRAPIEIIADNLVVRQQEQMAVFSGNVDAKQGNMSLRADELRVFYADDKSGRTGGNDQAIRRIEAAGQVVVAGPDQTAKGDRGVYDVAAGKVSLDGNVILTRADNIIRGGQLDLELATGIATLRSGRAATGQPERVRALFKPEPAAEATPGKRDAPKKER